MSGPDIIAELAVADASIVADLAGNALYIGAFPDGFGLPAGMAKTVSRIEDRPLRRGSTVRVTERVQLALRASTYEDLIALVKKCRTACADRIVPSLAGVTRIDTSIAGEGPDIIGSGGWYERSIDFRVGFVEPR